MLTPEELARQIAQEEGRLKPAAPKPVDAAMAQARQAGQSLAQPAASPIVDDDDWDAALNRIAAKHGVTPGSGIRSRQQQDGLIARGRSKAKNSYHLYTDRANRGARDFGGKPENMLAFAREVDQLYGKDLAELLHTPYRPIRDPLTARAHHDHVHVAWGRPYAQSPEALARQIAETERGSRKPAADEISPEDLARQIATTEGRARPTSTPATGLTPAMANRGVPMLPPIPGAGPAPAGPYVAGGGSRGSERTDLSRRTVPQPIVSSPRKQAGPPRPAPKPDANAVFGPRTYDPIHQRERRPATPLENLGNNLQRATLAIPENQAIVREYQGLQVQDPVKFPRFKQLSGDAATAKKQAAELRDLQRFVEFGQGDPAKFTPWQKANLKAMQALVRYTHLPENDRRLYKAAAIDAALASGGEVLGLGAMALTKLPRVAAALARTGKAAPAVQAGVIGGTVGAPLGTAQSIATENLQNPNAALGDYFRAGTVGGGLGLGMGLGLGAGGALLGMGAGAAAKALSRPRLGAPQIPPRAANLQPEAIRTQAPARAADALPVDRGPQGKFVPKGKGAAAARVPTLETATGSMRLTPGVEVEAPRLSPRVRFKVERVDEKGIVHLTAPNGVKAQVVKTELRAPEVVAPAAPEAAPAPKARRAKPKPLVTAKAADTSLPEGDLSSLPDPQLQNATVRLRREKAQADAELDRLENLDEVLTADQEKAYDAQVDALRAQRETLSASVGRAESELLRRRQLAAPPKVAEPVPTAPKPVAAQPTTLPEPPAPVARVPKTAPQPLKNALPAPKPAPTAAASTTATIDKGSLDGLIARVSQKGKLPRTELRKQLGQLTKNAEGDYDLTPQQVATLESMLKTARYPKFDEDIIRSGWKTPEPGSSVEAMVRYRKEERARAAALKAKPEAPLTELAEGGSLNARGSRTPPTRPRIAPAPLPGGSKKRLAEIVTDLGAAVNKRIQIGAPSRGARGTYYPGSTKTVIRNSGNLSTTAHEIGHVLDDRFGLVKPWNQKRVRSPFDAELLPHFSQHGSPMPTLAGKRLEAVAEFTRAYILNPHEAKKQAPAFFAHFEKSVPAEIRRDLISSGVEIRKLQGMPATDRLLANVRMEPAKVPVVEQAKTAVRGSGTGFETTKVDQLRAMVLDDLDPIMRGIAHAEDLRGTAAPLPSDDPALLIRLHAGVNGKIQNIFERGMIDTQGKRIASLEGGFARLLEPLDRSTEAALRRDQADTVAYMIAQRTRHVGEKAKAAGGSLYAPTVTGAGGGLEPDVLQAEKVIAEHLARPAAHRARIEAAAKLYREWSDSLLSYLEDSGRYSSEAVQAMRDENPYYVDLHRILGEDTSVPGRPAAGSGKKLGSSAQVLKRFQGSAKTIDNPYANLMEQTARAIKEADRNVAMRKFRDLLVNPRGIHQGKPIDLAAIGNRVPNGSTEANLITIYVDGKAEKWKFDDGIYQALQNWGRIPTDWFPTYLASFTRAAITHSPAFAIRNFIRDTIERKVSSPVDSGLHDLLPGVLGQGRDDLQLAGGSQAGHYLKDKLNYHREQTKIIRKLAQDKNTLVVGLQDLGRVVVELGEKSEQANRLAEYNAALKHATDRLGYGERDAQLYAANKARELLDFAQAGALVREINRYLPFTNAQVQGLRRSVRLIQERPAAFVAKWAGYVVAPTLAVYAYNQATGAMKEYQQLPTYQRDLFWNMKVGDRWLSIPKPHELGVLASGIERTLDRTFGNKRAFEGYSGTLAKQLMPVEDVPILGGYGPLIEAKANYDLFRDRPIVPAHEAGRALELREGTKNASRIGQALQSVVKQDARSIDFVIRGMTGGLGDLALRASDVGKPDSLRGTGEAALGLTKRSPLYNARDVQYSLKRAEELNRDTDPRVKNLLRMLRQASDAQGAEKARKERLARDFATRLRGSLERMKAKQPRR